MTHTDLKAHLALLKDVASDALDALNNDAHDAEIDVSSFAQQREASFRFEFNGPVTTAGLRTVLASISRQHNVDPGYVMVSVQDYGVLRDEMAGDPLTAIDFGPVRPIVILRVVNDATGNSARLVANPELQRGTVVFGVLYVSPVPQAISMTVGEQC